MRVLEVLGDGHPKLNFGEWKEFFEQEIGEWVPSQVKRMAHLRRDFFLDIR